MTIRRLSISLLLSLAAGCGGDVLPPEAEAALEGDGKADLLSPRIPIDRCALANRLDLRVPSQCPTVQAAVDRASDGAIIRVAVGVFVGRVVTGSKRLTIEGVSRDATSLRADGAGALVQVGPRGSLTLRNLDLVGGTPGIQLAPGLTGSSPSSFANPAALSLDRVGVRALAAGGAAGAGGGTGSAGADSGVRGPVDEFSMRQSNVLDSKGKAGVALTAVSKVVIADSGFLGNRAGGIDVQLKASAACSFALRATTVLWSGGPGVRVRGACPVTIDGVTVQGSVLAGVMLERTGPASLVNSSLLSTRSLADGRFGDGLQVSGGAVGVWNTLIEENARAGVLVAGCDASTALSLDTTRMSCNHGFDLDIETWAGLAGGACAPGARGPALTDGAGNACAPCDGPYAGCHAVSSSLSPIPL